MRSRSSLPFRAAPLRVEDPPSHGTLLTTFLSSQSLDEKSGCAVLYGAAVRHFLHWLGLHRIAIRTIDDRAVRRFEKHGCRCHRYSAQQAHYKADQAARVRRFVRFLEDQGYVEVDDGIDDLPRHLADYSDAIDRLQLAEGPAQAYRSEAEHFVAWLRMARRQWIDIDDTIIDHYAAHDCRCPVWRKRGKLVATGTKRRRRCARHFVEFLRGRGAIPLVEPVADDDPHMSAYLAWLKQHRGATDETIRRYRTDIRRLMPMLGEPSQWDAAGLRSAFQRRSKETPGSASLLVTIMRSYIRFLVVRGECRPALLHAVPSVQRYRLSTLPRHVDPATIERIIAACPTDRPVEVRDKAIILLLARLGLRAADIQNMRLDDIDWRSGHLTVKGKTRRPDRLPLPQDVGDAILAYLAAARPKAAEEHLFLRAQAPFRPFRSSAEIAGIVARTRDRGGIEGVPTGSHIFRHSLATNLLRAGAGLESVGTILRHKLARDHCHLRQGRSADAHEDRAALAGRTVMLNIHISRYVALHRSLGLKFSEQERMLRLYAAYAGGFGDRHTQVQRIYDWCHTSSSQYVARRRFDTARNFSLFAHAEDSGHEVPPAGVFGRGKRPRPTPTIIEPDQVRAIMTAALDVPPQGTISPHTYHYLFGLLAATGLRISEALALQCKDLVEDGLIVRNGKFGKQRLIALQPSTRQALEAYLALREKHAARGNDLFVTIRGRAPHKVRAHVVFVRLARQLGYRGPTGTAGMRLHDLRHTFAVRSLESCPPDREAIAHHMAGLSVYLGHASVANTYWYLEATPVLLRDIAAASEQLYRGEAA